MEILVKLEKETDIKGNVFFWVIFGEQKSCFSKYDEAKEIYNKLITCPKKPVIETLETKTIDI